MSWIVRDLWSTLGARRDEYAGFLETDRFRAYETVNKIVAEVGQRWGIILQLNFPPGRPGIQLPGIGHRDLSMIVSRNQRKFDKVSEADVKNELQSLNLVGLDPIGQDGEGFRAHLPDGRIDCLPGAIHLWCETTPDVLRVLDRIFTNSYGRRPSKASDLG